MGSVAGILCQRGLNSEGRIRTHDDAHIHVGILFHQLPNDIERLIILPLERKCDLVPIPGVVERKRGFEVVVKIRIESAEGPNDCDAGKTVGGRDVGFLAGFAGESFHPAHFG